MYFITTKRMLEVCFSAHPNIQYRTFYPEVRHFPSICLYFCVYRLVFMNNLSKFVHQ